MPKRTIADLTGDEVAGSSPPPRPLTKPRLSSPPAVQSTLCYPNTSQSTSRQIPFQKPSQIISFSYNSSHTLEFTDSALRYFVDPPVGAKLGYGYEHWTRRQDDRGRLDSLLRAFSRAQAKDSTSYLQDIGVIAWRGVMTKILTSPYEEREGWELNVMLVGDTMYFEEHLSEARLKQKNDMEPRHRLQTYYGYAFESYCTSETPTRETAPSSPREPIGWGGDVDTNVQWCSVVRTKLGTTRLVIGGEVDCVRGKYTGQTDSFVELKTSLTIRGPHDEAKFEKKLLKFYFQSFLLGVPEIIVGFRTPSGVVTMTQSFKTIQIPRLVRGKPNAWNPLVCLDWGEQFLSFLRDVVGKKSRHSEGDIPVWRVRFTPGNGVTVDVLDEAGIEDVIGGEDRIGFLPAWYWDELHAKGTHMDPRIREVASEAPLANAGWQI